jgi:REP-associated tyrosine transposase
VAVLLIRDDNDFEKHVNYIHYNPVKHGYVSHPIDWPFSTLHRYLHRGILPANWADVIMDVSTVGEHLFVGLAYLSPTYAS